MLLLDVAGGPGPGTADVGDEARDLLCGAVVGRHGDHGVLPGDGADDLQPLDPVENAGHRPRSSVTGATDDGVLCRGDVEDEARQDLYSGGAGLVRQRKIPVADLQDPELG